MHAFTPEAAAFSGFIDLASARVGGVALLANDEFFAEKENLLKPGRAVFIPDKYTERGKWMDGWESRRRRTPGNDWCVIQLGLRGIVKHVDIDTNHFPGNHPPFASLDALSWHRHPADVLSIHRPEGDATFPTDVSAIEGLSWMPILEKSPLNPGSQNLFPITNEQTWTHVRLNIFPD